MAATKSIRTHSNSGRPRTRNTHLPKRCYWKNGAYWHVQSGKWTRLSSNEKEAIEIAKDLNADGEARRLALSEIDRAKNTEDNRRKLSGKNNNRGLVVVLRWAPTAHKVVRERAKTKGMDFNLTLGDVQDLAEGTGGVCQFSGIPFSDLKIAGVFRRPWMPSIDRIDSSKGYVKGNCRIICVAANLALNDFGEAVFVRLAAQVAKHQTPG